MKIRKFRERDREEKQELHMETIRQVNSRDYDREKIDAWLDFDEENSIEEPEVERWVAVEDGSIIGFGDYIPDKGRITGIYVHPDHLRKGIATRLLEKIEEDAERRGIEKLSSRSSVTAKEFYEENGYRVMEESFHETSGEKLEAYEMEKKLDS